MDMKKTVALLLSMLLLLCACGKQADPIEGMILTTGDETGTYYQFGNLLARQVNAATTTFIATVSSEGSRGNIQSLARGDSQFAFTQYDVMLYARQGQETFRVNGPNESFSVVAALYPESVHVVTLDPGIKSVADLAGKRVSVGPAGSGSYFNAMDVLNAYGLTSTDIELLNYTQHDSIDALLGGRLDAVFVVAGAPVGTVTALTEERQVYLIGLEEEIIEKLIDESPAYSRAVIGADVYGTAGDCATVAVDAILIAGNSVPEDAVYDFVRGIYDNTAKLKSESPFGEYLSLDLAASVTGVPYHPGAARYYAEHGITVPVG
jgi:TRAP transporter TAXI family solute receptor